MVRHSFIRTAHADLTWDWGKGFVQGWTADRDGRWVHVSLRNMICVGYKSRFQTGRE